MHRMISGIDSFPLLAVFFIFAGNLMNSTGVTSRIYDFALSLVGWQKCAPGHVNIINQ
jgi:TRAP-type C4-dicarboxylate transport system permease large subunit